MMLRKVFYAIVIVVLLFNLNLFVSKTTCRPQTAKRWKLHDNDRPRPPIIQPGTASTQEEAGQPPSDATILFDGTDLSQWRTGNNEPLEWKVKDGYVECVRGKGPIYTVRNFGDCQLHVEWSPPFPAKGKGQGRGNSGIFLMSKYEIQVLDSYENETYADGQAAAIYGQYPPLVNACRPPGEWQSYDIIFHRPRFDSHGILSKPARITLFHNGVLVHDNVELTGPTMNEIVLPYHVHPNKLPLMLQDHQNPVRYRNIWVRELSETSECDKTEDTEIILASNIFDQYVGNYKVDPEWIITVKRKGNQLQVKNARSDNIIMSAQSERGFYSKMTSTIIDFQKNPNGKVKSLRLFHESGKVFNAIKID